MKSPKDFLVRSGVHPSLGERESDYTIVVDGYQREVTDSSKQRLIKYRKETLEELYEGSLPTRVRELVEVALATFAADRLVKRGPTENDSDDERMLSSRQVRIICPVSNTGMWKGVESELNHALSFITRDTFVYEFVESHDVGAEKVDMPEHRLEASASGVALFSGGLDSLGGVHHLKNRGSPKFVSVNHGHNVGHIINSFSELLNEDLIRVDVTPDFRGYESTQFSRSFMYIAIATAVSVALDTDEIHIPENGILARFPMLRHGWTTTRTVHPVFVRSCNRILDSLFPQRRLSIANPFLAKTKTDVVNTIPDTKQALHTRTCPHPRGLSEERDEEGHPMNCGLCLPCLIRVIALSTSDHDLPISQMLLDTNPFLELDFESVGPGTLESPSTKSVARTTERQTSTTVFLLGLNRILSFAHQLQRQPQRTVAADYVEALDDEVYEMYFQFSHEVFEFVDTVSDENPSLKQYTAEYLSIPVTGDLLNPN